MTKLGSILRENPLSFGLPTALSAIVQDTLDALSEMHPWERCARVFWLMGPFILLIERSPADAWLSMLAITFVVRTAARRDTHWLGHFWVRAGFVFWFWCIVAGAISDDPAYSVGEAAAWFRFPLFAMATVFWLARDRRLLHAMLLSTALGLLAMCGILTAEILIEGHKGGGRLDWPYGDLVPGGYVARVGLPAFTIMAALAVSGWGRPATVSGTLALYVLAIGLATGERINFLILACAGMLAGLAWRPDPGRTAVLAAAAAGLFGIVYLAFPLVGQRFTGQFVSGAIDFENSVWWHTLNGGLVVARDNWLFGIGTGNYRTMAHDLLEGIPFPKYDPHPHNDALQLLVETGVIGLALGCVFLFSMVWACLKSSLQHRRDIIAATAFVVPFGIFWPIATTADFFGQWNNIFTWSAVALAMCASQPRASARG